MHDLSNVLLKKTSRQWDTADSFNEEIIERVGLATTANYEDQSDETQKSRGGLGNDRGGAGTTRKSGDFAGAEVLIPEADVVDAAEEVAAIGCSENSTNRGGIWRKSTGG